MYPNFPSDGSLPDMSDHSQKSQGPPLPPLPRTQVPHAASNPPPSPAGTYHYTHTHYYTTPAGTYHYTLSVFRAAAARARLPFWNFFNAMFYKGSGADASDSQLAWQVLHVAHTL